MADFGTEYTDRRFETVRTRLEKVYGQAKRELEAKTADFWQRHATKSAKYQELVKRGKLSKEDYQAWLRGQVFQGQQWAAKVKQIADAMVNADKEAREIINGEKTGIFALNGNYIAYSLEHDAGVDLGFAMYDSNTVRRLIRDEPRLLPTVQDETVNESLDFRWYQKIVTNCVTQGIIQGETTDQIAGRIMTTCPDRGETAALRDARTAYTGAQNAGRIEGMHQAQELGIDVKKMWMSMLDDKVRDTHADLDGQVVGVDEDFVTIRDNAINYPGDPDAAEEEVYNCRCTLEWIYPKYPSDIERRDNLTGEDVGAMTYEEWAGLKSGAVPTKTTPAAPAKFEQYTKTEHDEQYSKLAAEYLDEQKKAFEADRRARSSSGEERTAAFEERNAHLAREREIQEEVKKYSIEVTATAAQKNGIDYLSPQLQSQKLTDDEIITRLAGGDLTKGSCASLAYCYIGQKAGYDVLDFRGGASQELIASQNKSMLDSLYRNGYDSIQGVARNYKTAGKRALNQAEVGKEYMFSCGRHAAIVRRTAKDDYQYLELQSGKKNGWVDFKSSEMDMTLKYRFGADIGGMGDVKATLVSVDQMAQSDRVLKILGYINTQEDKQMKGSGGHEK